MNKSEGITITQTDGTYDGQYISIRCVIKIAMSFFFHGSSICNDNFNLTMKEKIKYIQNQALSSWGVQEGIKRKNNVMVCIRRFTREYAKAFNSTPLEILKVVENRRDYCAVNFYQDCNFPSLKDKVEIFETGKDFFNKFPSQKFTCPMCNGISTDPNTCNSGDLMVEEKKSKKGKITQKAEICNWKSYGLFGTLGKGYKFVVKDCFLKKPIIYEYFPPIELKC